MRLYPIDKSLVCLQSEKRIMLELVSTLDFTTNSNRDAIPKPIPLTHI